VPVPQGYSNTVVNNAPYAAGGYNSGGAMPGVADPYGPGAPVGGGFPAQPGMSAPYSGGDSSMGCCSSSNQDLMWNMCLLLAFCAIEAVFAMICGSQMLMLDFYRRLGGVFCMVYSLEAIQARDEVVHIDGRDVARSAEQEIIACGNDLVARQLKMDQAALELRGMEMRRRIIATLLVGSYLLTVAFVQAMTAIVSMYGGAPDEVTQPGWILIIGALCGLLDLVHLRYGVEVILDLSNETGFSWTHLLNVLYGSMFVVTEAFCVMIFGGGFIDPLLVLMFAAAICAGSTDVVTKAASALQNQAWQERV